MGNFNSRDNRGGGFRGGNGGGRPSFGGNRGMGDRREITMHKAVCDECKKNCEVPFKPSSDKPIYCNECFGGKRGNDRHPSFEDRGPKKSFNDRPDFVKPQNSREPNNLDKQLTEINNKIDRLVNIIEKFTNSKQSEVLSLKTTNVVKNENKKTPVVIEKSKKITKKGSIKTKVLKAPVKKVLIKKKK